MCFIKSLFFTLREMCPNTKFFSGPYFLVFSPNSGKYGLEKTQYMDNFDLCLLYIVTSLLFELHLEKVYDTRKEISITLN